MKTKPNEFRFIVIGSLVAAAIFGVLITAVDGNELFSVTISKTPPPEFVALETP